MGRAACGAAVWLAVRMSDGRTRVAPSGALAAVLAEVRAWWDVSDAMAADAAALCAAARLAEAGGVDAAVDAVVWLTLRNQLGVDEGARWAARAGTVTAAQRVVAAHTARYAPVLAAHGACCAALDAADPAWRPRAEAARARVDAAVDAGVRAALAARITRPQ
jgi:hypothetical protein